MSETLLTSSDIAGWRRRLVEIADQEKALNDERLLIQRKLEAVAVLFGAVPVTDAAQDEPDSQPMVRQRKAASQSSRPTWSSEIMRVFNEMKQPLTFDMLKEALESGPLKGEYKKSEKGFYHGISRLQKDGSLTKHRGWLFRTSDWERHVKQVDAGEVEDVADYTNGPPKASPMGDAIVAFVAARPGGTTGPAVVAHLKQDERFRETLSRNNSGAYNVIARLVGRGQIKREGRVIYPLNENEPSADGSDAKTEKGYDLLGFLNSNPAQRGA